jgi:hypothetical protein
VRLELGEAGLIRRGWIARHRKVEAAFVLTIAFLSFIDDPD